MILGNITDSAFACCRTSSQECLGEVWGVYAKPLQSHLPWIRAVRMQNEIEDLVLLCAKDHVPAFYADFIAQMKRMKRV